MDYQVYGTDYYLWMLIQSPEDMESTDPGSAPLTDLL